MASTFDADTGAKIDSMHNFGLKWGARSIQNIHHKDHITLTHDGKTEKTIKWRREKYTIKVRSRAGPRRPVTCPIPTDETVEETVYTVSSEMAVTVRACPCLNAP